MLKLPKHSLILELYEQGILCDCKGRDYDWERVVNSSDPLYYMNPGRYTIISKLVTKHTKTCSAQAKLMEAGYDEKELNGKIQSK